MSQDEQVLVIKRAIFDELGSFHGLMFDVQRYLDKIFAPGNCTFMPRPLAEKDPSFKQLIPYVIMGHDGKYLSYVRGKRAGETRLVSKRSIGIGGHINPVDSDSMFNRDVNSMFKTNFFNTYLDAVQREIAEEVNVDTTYTNKIVALLNDDTNEVGQVHLGVVHFWNLEAPKVERKEQMITQLEFMSAAELNNIKDSMETWSSLCLEGIKKMDN
jgi:predicted NUDIX family phosphoesterase